MSNADDVPQSWVFNRDTLDLALEEWKAAQIEAYPHQEELIQTTALAMRDFLDSEFVKRNKMTM